MDKKDAVIAVSWLALAALALEYSRLVHDFKLLASFQKENEETVEQARDIVTAVIFEDIIENFDED